MNLLPLLMGLVSLAMIFVGLVLLCPAAALVGAGLLVGRVAFVLDQGARQ